MIKIASPKKNKNNPDNKSNGINGKGSNKDTKQNKLRSSEYCETQCKDIDECQKYKDYMARMVVLHKVGKGLLCDK